MTIFINRNHKPDIVITWRDFGIDKPREKITAREVLELLQRRSDDDIQ